MKTTKLQINAKFSNDDVKSAVFAVSDSLNFHIEPDALKLINVPKIADQIVSNTKRQYGDGYTKVNLESVLNQTIKNMSTATKSAIKQSKPAEKEATKVNDEDMAVINAPDAITDIGKSNYMAFNEKIKRLPHLWNSKPLLVKLLGKSRQRVNNAIRKAKNKQI